ncbi:MAG: hypothetical protein RSA84_11415, partial [Acinetobacter sp.]
LKLATAFPLLGTALCFLRAQNCIPSALDIKQRFLSFCSIQISFISKWWSLCQYRHGSETVDGILF